MSLPINQSPLIPAADRYTTCLPPPADPTGPGFHRNTGVDAGPNHFTLGVNGPDPLFQVGGTHDEQEHQRDVLLALDTRAGLSYGSRLLPDGARYPPDASVQDILQGLNTNPPIGQDGREVTHAVYQSQIPNATPQDAFEHFINHPNEVFNAGGMEIRPPTDRLTDGGRYMLEIGGPPPTWLPIEVKVDAANHAFSINTLDGHVLRGAQTFTFSDDCNGGTVLTQDARFQASTKLVGDVQQVASIAASQHEGWQLAHREIYEQFNGDRDYKGMGTDFNPGQWLEFAKGLVKDPGATLNVTVDALGEIGNEVFDEIGNWTSDLANLTGSSIDDFMDWVGVPGGDTVASVIGTAGDLVQSGADLVGDATSAVADVVGDGAEAVVDFINPFD